MKTTATASNSKDKLAFLGALTTEDRLTVGKIYDAVRLSSERYSPYFTNFLDLRQKKLAKQVLNAVKVKGYLFYGGFDDAERTVLGVFPEYEQLDADLFPVNPLTFTYRKEDWLTHRDFLGTFMSLDIKRETIGDIAVGEGLTVAFVKEQVARLLLESISKVGGVGVRITEGVNEKDIPKQSFTELDVTLSSLRADCVVSGVTRLSRDKSSELIKKQGIVVNGESIFSPSYTVTEGSVFSVRGFGKYKFVKICGFTRKNRVTVEIYRFD